MKHGRNPDGFTLIELSIVLVVIGLIVGGILVGRDMIEGSEIRADIRERETIETAITTFKLKYNCLPGDCANATSFLGGGQFGSLPNGDGNGTIRGYMDNGLTSETLPDMNGQYLSVGPFSHTQWGQEWYSMFEHLAVSGLYNIPQYDVGDSWTPNVTNNWAGRAYPQMHWQHGTYDPVFTSGVFFPTIPGGIIVGREIDAHYVRFGACPFMGWGQHTMTFSCGYTAAAAHAFDNKVDDGMPVSGSVQVTEPAYILRNSTTSPSGGPSANCANASSYTSQTNYRACSLRVKASF